MTTTTSVPDSILDAYLLSDRDRTALLMFADLLEEAGHPSADDVRGAIDLVVEPRGRGWFVGFAFPSRRDRGDWRPDLEPITNALAHRACALGERMRP